MANPLTLTVDQIIEQASDAIGGGPYTGDKLRKAKLDLELTMIELVNDGVPLSLVREITFTSSTQIHTFDSDIRDVWDIVDSTDNIALSLNQVDLATFNQFNITNQTGRPTQFATHKDLNATTIRFHPVPDKTYTYRAFVDVEPTETQNYDDTLSVRSIYLPAIIAGLTYRLAMRNPDIDLPSKQAAKDSWLDLKENALDADRDRSSIFIRPGRQRRW
ncbi:MAG: hypothetical protein HRT61_01400 [Ekhidna sp.]|nr:hypothetical protein [Ekhidna sp.]